ncbi:hypothetical protein HK405_015193, partial [Cladochytrium tenue]
MTDPATQPLLAAADAATAAAAAGAVELAVEDGGDGEQPLPGLWHHRVAATIESPGFHWAVLILTVADLALVVAEIALALEERCGSGGGDGDKEEEEEWLVILRHLSTGILILFGFEIGLRLFVFGH